MPLSFDLKIPEGLMMLGATQRVLRDMDGCLAVPIRGRWTFFVLSPTLHWTRPRSRGFVSPEVSPVPNIIMTHVVRQHPTWSLGICPKAEPLGSGVSTGQSWVGSLQTSGPQSRCHVPCVLPASSLTRTTQASDQLSSIDPQGEPRGTGCGPDLALPQPL